MEEIAAKDCKDIEGNDQETAGTAGNDRETAGMTGRLLRSLTVILL